jgi:hypothetical protein
MWKKAAAGANYIQQKIECTRMIQFKKCKKKMPLAFRLMMEK